ncbi:MAG: PDZ domain-containing protein [Ferruginibacter sp.]
MKTNIKLSIIGWLVSCVCGYEAVAQTVDVVGADNNKKETQEIIIRKKGDRDTKLTMEISNDKILINGKPLAEFNESGISINNRKILIREGNAIKLELSGTQNEIENRMQEFEKSFGGIMPEDIENISIIHGDEIKTLSSKPSVFLGVTTENNTDGAKILSVVSESPAQKAGLHKDDIIYKIDDRKINGSAELSDVVKSMKVNDKVKIYFTRDGKSKDVIATLSESKTSLTRTMTITSKDGTVKTLTMPRMTPPRAPMGFEENWSENFNGSVFTSATPKLGLKIQDTEDGNSVKVLDVEEGSTSATAGLQKDDLITEIAGAKVQNTDDAREQLQLNKEKSNYSIKAKRNGNDMTFTIKIPKKLKTANL